MDMVFPREPYLCRQFIPITRHEKCNCVVVSLKPFFEYNEPNTWSELVSIVANSDIKGLDRYIGDNRQYRIVDRHGNSPLHIAVIFNKMDVVNYLLTVKQVRVNSLNRYGQTPLHLAVINNTEDIFTELIKHGGDVNMGDTACCTPLHAAAARYCPKLCEQLLELGADINFPNLLGKTALYHACQYGTPDSVYMLLYHGAQAIITDVYGILPLTAAMQQCADCDGDIPESQLDCHEIIFNHTFERHRVSVNLSNLTVAMKIHSPIFPELLSRIESVKYSSYDLKDLAGSAVNIKPECFKLFTRRFGHVVKEMLMLTPPDLCPKLTVRGTADTTVLKVLNFLTMILKFRPTYNFIKGSTSYSYIISNLVSLYKEQGLSRTVFEQAVYFMYSYGLPCEFPQVVLLYETFGFNDLVKFVLQLDIFYTLDRPKTAVPYLLCDINLTVDTLLLQLRRPCKEQEALLKFFVAPKVRNFFSRSSAFRTKLRRLPTVPSMMELSREAARKHIINTFQIKSTADFYNLLKKMPINNVYKKILTYEREVYRF